MSGIPEVPVTTPKKGGRRPARRDGHKHESQIDDITVAPNTKKNKQRVPRNNISNQVLMSPPPGLVNDTAFVESLQIDGHSNLQPQNNTQKKRRARKKTGEHNQNVAAQSPYAQLAYAQPIYPQPVYPQSPPPADSTAIHGTPIGKSLYAGGAFNSPAPSSLPTPKGNWFSKGGPSSRTPGTHGPTVPPPPETPSDHSGDSVSEEGGDSPTMRPTLRALNNLPPAQPSPAQFLFDAVNKEKAMRIRLEASLAENRAKSASPAHAGLTQPPSQASFPKPQSPAAADCSALTRDLKRLLLFPDASKPPPSADARLGSPFTRPGVERAVSASSTPTRSVANADGSPFERPSFNDYRYSQTPPSIRPGARARPFDQHLRPEYSNSGALDQSPDIRMTPANRGHFA